MMFHGVSMNLGHDQFHRIDRSIISKNYKSKRTFPTLDSNFLQKKVNVILIPDFVDYSNRNSLQNSQHQKTQQKRKIKRKQSLDIYVNPNYCMVNSQNPNMLDLSYIHKYLWDQFQSNDITQHSRKYNISYQSPLDNLEMNSKMGHQNSNFAKKHQNSVHFCSINMKQKSPNLTKFNSFNDKIIYEENSDSYIDSQNLISKNGNNGNNGNNGINRDTNIDIWHTHGLKFGSNVLKFGIRNKHIAMVVYHKHQNFGLSSMTSINGEIEPQFNKHSQKWSNFIRQVNKKCIIAHLFIKQSIKMNSAGQNIGSFKQKAKIKQCEDKIKITQIQDKVNQYRIDIQIKTKTCENSSRILLIIDSLLQQHVDNDIFQKQQMSYSNIDKIIKKVSEPIPSKFQRPNNLSIMSIKQQIPNRLSYNSVIKKRKQLTINPINSINPEVVQLLIFTPPNKKSRLLNTIQENQSTALKTNKACESNQRQRSPFFLHTSKNKSISRSQNQNKSKQVKGLSLLSKLDPPKKKNSFQLFDIIKSFCFRQSEQQKSELMDNIENPIFYQEQNKKTKSNPIKKNLFTF